MERKGQKAQSGERLILVSITYVKHGFSRCQESVSKPPILLLLKHTGHFSLCFESGKPLFLLLVSISLTTNLHIPLRAGKYRHVSPEASCTWQRVTTPSLKIKTFESHPWGLPVDDGPGSD